MYFLIAAAYHDFLEVYGPFNQNTLESKVDELNTQRRHAGLRPLCQIDNSEFNDARIELYAGEFVVLEGCYRKVEFKSSLIGG